MREKIVMAGRSERVEVMAENGYNYPWGCGTMGTISAIPDSDPNIGYKLAVDRAIENLARAIATGGMSAEQKAAIRDLLG